MRIVIVEDEAPIREGMEKILKKLSSSYVLAGKACDGLEGLEVIRREKPDVVIMDPPRAGSDMPFLRSLLALAPKRVVYVSCNPETLARDVAVLCAGGYRAEKAVPVDMFPWTEHVETVVLMSRVKD